MTGSVIGNIVIMLLSVCIVIAALFRFDDPVGRIACYILMIPAGVILIFGMVLMFAIVFGGF